MNKCFYVEISLLSHCKSEKSCQKTTKKCNFLTFTGTQMRLKAMRKRPYFTMESDMNAILRNASGKMHYGILFAPSLSTLPKVLPSFKLVENRTILRWSR